MMLPLAIKPLDHEIQDHSRNDVPCDSKHELKDYVQRHPPFRRDLHSVDIISFIWYNRQGNRAEGKYPMAKNGWGVDRPFLLLFRNKKPPLREAFLLPFLFIILFLARWIEPRSRSRCRSPFGRFPADALKLSDLLVRSGRCGWRSILHGCRSVT